MAEEVPTPPSRPIYWKEMTLLEKLWYWIQMALPIVLWIGFGFIVIHLGGN